jgi:hypothetical protein
MQEMKRLGGGGGGGGSSSIAFIVTSELNVNRKTAVKSMIGF